MDWELFLENPLFEGITKDDMGEMLTCLGAEEKEYKKGSFIYRTGDIVRRIGFVTGGSVNLIKDDVWGNTQILDHVREGQIFAETYACLGQEPLMLNVQAAENTKVLFLYMENLLSTCNHSCPFHSRLIRNLLKATAAKNLNLARKIDLLTPKSIRERVMGYLSLQALRQGRDRFEIPFNRQQLADYLAVDRSALSNELSKLRKEGFIEFKKNYFVIKRNE